MELMEFSNVEFGNIRTVMVNGKPYFVGRDVANALGYLRPADAISAHCKGSVKHRVLTNGGIQEVKVIPEGDVYRLVIRSNLPEADRFESWIFDDIIPSIRKTGGYHLPQTFVEALRELADKVDENKTLRLENQEMKPKAEFFDAVTGSKNAIEMRNVAKILDMGIGRNKLFEFLRNENVLMKDNTPYQKYIDAGYFRVVEQKFDKGYGEVGISIKTLVYQKGG